jgi:two-component sensor histidine kinase
MTSANPTSPDPVEQRIRELHHRTKNDLQGIAGLLQASAGAHPQAARELNQAAARIQAVAHVHGLQMSSHHGVPAYDLVRAVANHQASLAGLEIAWADDEPASKASSAEATVSAADAVSIALVVTELILNAIAAAASHGELAAHTHLQDGSWVFVLRNRGQLPSGFEFSRIGRAMHGLGLAKSLTPRRGAELLVQQDGAFVVASLSLQEPALLCVPRATGVPG